jgi:choline dehydrogenase
MKTETSEADYVVIGAGSAGCVLANRLSEAGHSVIVLEAGPMDRHLMIHIPAGVYSVYKDPKFNWNYLAAPDPGVDGREIELPRGRVVGGSSSINAMVYMRGHPLDYDRWADLYDLPAWRFENCLPYFKAAENSDRGGSDWRGDSGPLNVTRGHMDNPLYDALWEAGGQSGQGQSEDLNGFKPEGIARLDRTTREGRRCSAAVAHLRPALRRSHVHLVTGALVHRILVDHGMATGVRFALGDEVREVFAGREVILSAGAINSPQLLKLSGIGPENELRQHGIDTVLHLPGVGENLQDHLNVHHVQACSKPVTLDYLQKPLARLGTGLHWLWNRGGVAASNIWEMGGLVYGGDDLPHPNLQYHFGAVWPEYRGRDIRLHQAWTMSADQLRPFSRGRVTLRSGNPADAPIAQFNYLSDRRDVLELMDGVRKMQEIFSQKAFDEFRGDPILPGPGVRTDEEVEAFVRATANTDYHPCGTCRMGGDSDSVVDGELRLRGIERLRVVDASVMPDVVSGNLNAPTQMIAARAADILLGKTQLPAFRPAYHFEMVAA